MEHLEEVVENNGASGQAAQGIEFQIMVFACCHRSYEGPRMVCWATRIVSMDNGVTSRTFGDMESHREAVPHDQER